MMLRHSEMEAKKASAKRLSDPHSDIKNTSDQQEADEVQERRVLDREIPSKQKTGGPEKHRKD